MAYHDGVDRRIDRVGARDRLIHQLLRADLAVADERGKAERVVISILLEAAQLRTS